MEVSVTYVVVVEGTSSPLEGRSDRTNDGGWHLA